MCRCRPSISEGIWITNIQILLFRVFEIALIFAMKGMFIHYVTVKVQFNINYLDKKTLKPFWNPDKSCVQFFLRTISNTLTQYMFIPWQHYLKNSSWHVFITVEIRNEKFDIFSATNNYVRSHLRQKRRRREKTANVYFCYYCTIETRQLHCK